MARLQRHSVRETAGLACVFDATVELHVTGRLRLVLERLLTDHVFVRTSFAVLHCVPIESECRTTPRCTSPGLVAYSCIESSRD